MNIEDILLFLFYLIGIAYLSGLFSSGILCINPNMMMVIGNPKPIYFFDVQPSCNNLEEANIVSSLNLFSNTTGVRFIQLNSQISLYVGGISFRCEHQSSNSIAGLYSHGEQPFAGGFVIAWHDISLWDTSSQTVIHETLHAMGFDHSPERTSIMYPYENSMNQNLNEPLITFIKETYANNPFAYLNVIPTNMHYIFALMIILLLMLFEKINPANTT